MNYELVVLDLDGVLINSKENMRISWNKVQKRFDLQSSFEEYFSKIGKPFQIILKDLDIKDNQYLIEKLYYETSTLNEKKLSFYSGVISSLIELKKRKYKISICTSKNLERTVRILKNIPIEFNSINCPESGLKGKPFPDQLIKAIDLAKIKKEKVVYVGDTIIDKQTAFNANVKFIFAKYGYGFLSENNTVSIDNFADLLNFL